MKCSSRRNCDVRTAHDAEHLVAASMKCSSRRNCDQGPLDGASPCHSLNEVQFPKELRP